MRHRDRIPINTHLGAIDYTDTGYVHDVLNDLGITVVRDDDPNTPRKLPGIKVITVIGTDNATHAAEGAARAVRNGCWMLQGVNEPKNLAKAKVANNAIVKAAAGHVPVIHSPLPLPDMTRARSLGPLVGAAMVDLHVYRADRPEAEWEKWRRSYYQMLSEQGRRLPWMVSEFGAHRYQGPDSHKPTAADVYGRTIVPDILTLLREGAEQVAVYELLCQVKRYGSEREGLFGLLDPQGRPTPAYNALKAHLAEFGDYDHLAVLDMAPKMAAAYEHAAQAAVLLA